MQTEGQRAERATSHPVASRVARISILAAPVQSLLNTKVPAIAGEIHRHLTVQLSREPNAVVVGASEARYVLRTSVRREMVRPRSLPCR